MDLALYVEFSLHQLLFLENRIIPKLIKHLVFFHIYLNKIIWFHPKLLEFSHFIFLIALF